MKILGYLSLVSLSVAVFSAACGDDEETTTGTQSTTRTTTTTTTTTTTGPGSGGAGGGGVNCTQVCDDLWTCTQEDMNCPALMPGDEEAFKMGCVTNCMNTPALAGLVDPMDCAGTVMTLVGVSPEFNAACNGAGGAGGGG